MAGQMTVNSLTNTRRIVFQDYRQILLMGSAAVLVSLSTIVYYNHKMYYELIEHAYNALELIAITLMPYMISAVVATIAAIGITSMLPSVKSAPASRQIHQRVKQLADGDLTVLSRLDCQNPHYKDIAGELNYAIGFLGSSVAQWKIINRQQWDLLEGVRKAALTRDYSTALKMIEKMEENWKMTAAIENRFQT